MFRSPTQPMWDLTIHHSSGPTSSLALVPISNRYGTPQSTPLQGTASLLTHPSVQPPSRLSLLAGTPLVSTPLQGSASLLAHSSCLPPSGLSLLTSTPLMSTLLWSSLAHRPMSGSDTICNNSSPPLADIVLFGLSLKVFKTCQLGCRERFPHPYKLCFILLHNQRKISHITYISYGTYSLNYKINFNRFSFMSDPRTKL